MTAVGECPHDNNSQISKFVSVIETANFKLSYLVMNKISDEKYKNI
jgi:hypothetical protein